jgi:hypothetical protein
MKKAIYLLTIIPLLLLSFQVMGNYSIARFDNEWCSSTFPTSYATGSFSISETDINGTNGFTKNQNNKTLQIDLPAGFEFKTSGTTASISASGTEVSVISFSFSSVTRLIVTISTSSNNTEYNTIYFDNFEIRAMNGSASGDMLRTGGTFKIDNSTSNPTSFQSFGFFSSQKQFIYISNSVDQTNLTDVKQYSINNDIIRIKITGSGNCGGAVTQFTFSTDGNNGTGTDSVRNISSAKVYYTGNSSVFTAPSYFGSYFSPSGNFVIPGSINLLNGDNYFWLCYDVPGDAYTNASANKLDASLISFIVNGNLETNITTPSPAGYRKVVPAQFYYTISSGNWTGNIWATTNNGLSCNCQPNGAGIAIIDTGHAVTMNATRTVDVVQVMKDASLSGLSASLTFTATTALITNDNGYFDFLGDIAVGGNIILNGSGTSRFHKNMSIGGDLFIATDATLYNNAVSTLDVPIGGNLTVNGSLQNTGGDLILNGGNTFIDGTGIITSAANVVIENGSKTVLATADLDVNAGLLIQGPYGVDNYGKIIIRGNMDANNSVSNWFNESGSDLSYGGSATMFASNGYLAAYTDFNTVRYSGKSNQNIIIPRQSTYYNLALEGSGTKSLMGDTHLHGNFICDAAFGHNQKIMIVDGKVMQYFLGSVPPTLYDLTMLNTADGLTLQLPVFYEGLLTLTDGKIFTSMTNILTATDNAKATSGSLESFVNGPMQKIGNDAFVYPVGKDTIWARIGISAPQTTAARFIAEYFPEKYINTTSVTAPLNHVSTIEYWNLLRNVSSDSVKVQLYWENEVRSGINDYPNLLVAGWSGISWLSKGQSTITGADPGNITSVVVKTFGPFTFGSHGPSNPLPVVYLNYNAAYLNNMSSISWTTSSETNNDFFTIEKSKNLTDIFIVGTVAGAGISNSILNYTLTDKNPGVGTVYYRIRQTDYDGASFITNWMSVDIPLNNVIGVSVDNSTDQIKISFGNDVTSNFVINVYDIIGHRVATVIRPYDGESTMSIDLNKNVNGIYIVNISSENYEISKKVVFE